MSRSSYVLILFAAVLCFIPMLINGVSISECEYTSLKDLYEATNGAAWRWTGTVGIWDFTNTSSDPCLSNWQGVNCTGSGSSRTLRALNLPQYNLKGTLPPSLGNLTNLQRLSFKNNSLSGNVPSTLCNLTQLQILDLDVNSLTGTIPMSLSNLTRLQRLELDRNSLKGTIPRTLGRLKQLRWLELDSNSLSGTIPLSLGDLTQLQWLGLDRNSLTGNIPSTLRNLTQLQILYLGVNSLTGTIPWSLGNLTQLRGLGFDRNSLTGKIPSSFNSLTHLQYFYLNSNYLTGTIPSNFNNLTRLQDFFLHRNYLTGTIPSTLGYLKRLQSLLLNDNFLTGKIPESLFSQGIIDVSSNLLTGKIPSSIFGRSNLSNFVASKNCLSPEFPESICDQSSLTSLILNGVGANERCVTRPSKWDKVSFPRCIWSMLSLKQLYIAGNGLRGKLQIFEMSNLKNLSINSNRFTGTLSTNYTFHGFEIFDISSNRVTGYLNTYFDAKQAQMKPGYYYADTNRLSGPVNLEAIELYDKVDVLSGNSISCNTIPRNDVVYIDYELFSDCETRPVYYSIIIWCIALGVAFVIGSINYKNVIKATSLWRMKYRSYFDTKIIQSLFPRAIQEVASIQKLHTLVFITSLCMVIALVAIYSGFEFSKNANKDYKVQFEKYNYAFSGIYLKSVSPAVVLWIVFTLFAMMSIYIVYRIFLIEKSVRSYATIFILPPEDSISTNRQYTFVRYVLYVLFVGISLLMNVGYVYGLSRNVNVLALQIAFFICNSLYQFYGSDLFISYLNKSARLTKIESAMFHATIMTFIGIINPCLATLVIDNDCFRDYIWGVSSIDASYTFQLCANTNVVTKTCDSFQEFYVSSSVEPSFIYSHQCRDAVFGNYIPVIFLSCAFNTFVYPFLYISLTSGIKSLNLKKALFLFEFDSRNLVIEDTIVRILEGIIFDIVLMILFGIAYPLCLLFLLIDMTSRIYLFIRRLHLYIELYQRTLNNNPAVDKVNSEYLENMVIEAILIGPYLIWPGLGAASVIFGLYLFDMAWDTEENDLGAPIAVLLMTIISFIVICVAFFTAKAKLKADLAARVESSIDDKAATTGNEIVARSESDCDVELATNNPILV